MRNSRSASVLVFGVLTSATILHTSAQQSALIDEIENAMGGSFTSEVVEFRPDLSYFPSN